MLEREDLAPFLRHFIQEDLETLLEFYERCPKRNLGIKRILGLSHELIEQTQLDDYLVMTNPSLKDEA